MNELPEPFLRKVEINADGCWRWTGALTKGYGRSTLGGGGLKGAHRIVYEALVGPIPDGLQLDHLCRNRACVNPSHLEPVTGWENRRRGASPPARNAAAVACIHGHPFDDANTYVLPRGAGRDCRTCRRAAANRYYQRKRKVVAHA